MQKTIFFYLVLFCTMTMFSSVYAQNIPVANSASQSLQQEKSAASKLLADGKYQEAFVVYSKLLREDPTDDIVNLGYARSALRAKKSGQAVIAYERLLTKYPNQPILTKELALALSMQKDISRAMHELASNPATAKDAKRLANKINSENGWIITGNVKTGLMYDSNVNGGPASNSLTLGNWQVNLNNAKEQDSLAGYFSTQINFYHGFDDQKKWGFVGDASFYARHNTHSNLYDMGLISSEWGTLSAGIRYGSSNFLMDLRLRGQIFDYSFEQNITAFGPELYLAYAINPNIHLITRANAAERIYSNSPTFNGWYVSAGQYIRFFMNDRKNHFTFGGRYLGGYAQELFNTYEGFEVSASFSFELPYDITFSPAVSYSEKYFYSPATILETVNRNDYRLNIGATFDIPIAEAWSVELGYQYSNNLSSSNLYTYDQHRVNIGLAWSF